MATTSSSDTVAIGFARISAKPLIAANPTRKPVNEPGPEATAKASMSCFLKPCFERSAAICGTSCAENVPPARGTTSITSHVPLFKPCASAMLPCLPEVSAARMSMELKRRFQSAEGLVRRSSSSTNSSKTPPALGGGIEQILRSMKEPQTGFSHAGL